MRQKRTPNFRVEIAFKELPKKEQQDRLQQLWNLLISLPDVEEQKLKESREHERN